MNLYWLLRFYTELEQSMNSVERINDYMDVPSEPASIIEGHRPAAYWPSNQGGATVENLVLKYAPELEPVLHGVSFEIKVRINQSLSAIAVVAVHLCNLRHSLARRSVLLVELAVESRLWHLRSSASSIQTLERSPSTGSTSPALAFKIFVPG